MRYRLQLHISRRLGQKYALSCPMPSALIWEIENKMGKLRPTDIQGSMLACTSLSTFASTLPVMTSILRMILPCWFPRNLSGDQSDEIAPSKQTPMTEAATQTLNMGTQQRAVSPSTLQCHQPMSAAPDNQEPDESDISPPTTRAHSFDDKLKPDSLLDPDDVIPVKDLQPQQEQQRSFVNVKDALEDRRKMFERLRRPQTETMVA